LATSLVRWLVPLVGVAFLGAAPGLAQTAGPFVRIIDGDTYVLLLEGLPTPVRLANADTPETGPRARYPEERALGERATAWVRLQVQTRQVAVFPGSSTNTAARSPM
jgi:endonuclease YncB( thermonuclease family)